MPKPRISNPDFRYTPASKTDIRKTFERIRREMSAAEKARPAKVTPIKRKAVAG